jgi:glycosyltransferase involved in cell wall biosynthesis
MMTKSPTRQWPKISIVTPSFNQGIFLENTIQSILVQNYPNLEYIIMDGGSTDNSLEVIRRYEPNLFHWESASDNGQYDALQKGFSHTHGDIMGYLNSDDLYFPWTLRVVGEIFATFPQVEWLTTSCTSATPIDAQFPLVYIRYNRSRRRFLETRDRLLKQRDFIQQESTFWRRSLWEKAGGRLDTRLKYAGDFELWARFFEHTSPVTVNIPLAMFRFHGNQKTSDLEKYILEAENVLSRYPRPLWVPALFIRFLNLIYLGNQCDANWLGARCDRVEYDPREDYWVYRKYLEWRD